MHVYREKDGTSLGSPRLRYGVEELDFDCCLKSFFSVYALLVYPARGRDCYVDNAIILT